MWTKILLVALFALTIDANDRRQQSVALLEKMIESLKGAGKLEGRHELALSALREEFPDLVDSVGKDNRQSSNSSDLYSQIEAFLSGVGSGNTGSGTTPDPDVTTAKPYDGQTNPGSGSYPGPGGSYPNPGPGGSYPNPGPGGSYPNPGSGGSYPNPGPGGSYPNPGPGGSYPNPNPGSGSYPNPGPYVPPNPAPGGYGPGPNPNPGGYGQTTPSPGGYGQTNPSTGGYGNQGGGYGHGPDHIKEEIFSIMDTIFAIMKWQGLIYDSDNPVWTLIDRGFELLADFVKRNLHHNKHEGECPYSFDTAGELCLSVDLNALNLKWHEARLYCQIVKGGDLGIFRDANQLRDMQSYLRSFDKHYKYSYWIGASDVKQENHWEFINGEPVPFGTPYWGRTTEDGRQNPSGGDDYDYAILYGRDFFYMADINDDDAELIKVVPLCQYFQGRGPNAHRGYHSHDGLYHNNANNIADKLASILGLSSASKPHSGEHKSSHEYRG